MHLYSSCSATVVNKVIISRVIKQTRKTFMFTHLLSEKIKDAHLAWEDINEWRHECKCRVNKNRKYSFLFAEIKIHNIVYSFWGISNQGFSNFFWDNICISRTFNLNLKDVRKVSNNEKYLKKMFKNVWNSWQTCLFMRMNRSQLSCKYQLCS